MDTHQPSSVIGSFRRFGSAGPAYQVMSYSKIDDQGHQWMNVHIFQSDEDVEYRLDHLLEDPAAD